MKGLLSICLLALPTIMAIAPDADAQRVIVGRGHYWNSPYWRTHRYGPWRGGAAAPPPRESPEDIDVIFRAPKKRLQPWRPQRKP